MICPACGTPSSPGVNFCARCGTATATAPQHVSPLPPPIAPQYAVPYIPQPRVRQHLQALGILWYVLAAYRVIAGIIGALFLTAFAGHSPVLWGHEFNGSLGDVAPHWIAGAMVPVVLVLTLAVAALAAVVGWGLLNRQPWGRTLAIVGAVLSLFKFPFGTALGIYTLWVIAPAPSGAEWQDLTGSR